MRKWLRTNRFVHILYMFERILIGAVPNGLNRCSRFDKMNESFEWHRMHWVDLSHHQKCGTCCAIAISIFFQFILKTFEIPYFNFHLSKPNRVDVIILWETISVHLPLHIYTKYLLHWVYWTVSPYCCCCCTLFIENMNKLNLHFSVSLKQHIFEPVFIVYFPIVLLGTFLVFFNEIDQFSIWYAFSSSVVQCQLWVCMAQMLVVCELCTNINSRETDIVIIIT